MLTSLAVIIAGYLIGSVPAAYIAGRMTSGVDIREVGSGNAGASNIWQTASRGLVVPVGLTQIAQGAGAVLLARALGAGEGIQVTAGVAAVVANDWNPWLQLRGGRGVGLTIGIVLVLSPIALVAFIAIALAGVALRAIPQAVALALISSPIAVAVAGESLQVVAGFAALALIAMVKRVAANGPPDEADWSAVWPTRLIYDRDIRDREAWVRRGIVPGER